MVAPTYSQSQRPEATYTDKRQLTDNQSFEVSNLVWGNLRSVLIMPGHALTSAEPESTVPVRTVPWPLNAKQWSTANRKEPFRLPGACRHHSGELLYQNFNPHCTIAWPVSTSCTI